MTAPPAARLRGRALLARLRGWLIRREVAGTTRRRPADSVRAVVAATLLIGLAFEARQPATWEREVVRFFEPGFNWADTVALALYDLVLLWSVVLLAAVLVVRRWRLARDLVAAAFAAVLVGCLLTALEHGTGPWDALQAAFDVIDPPRFPLLRLGMSVAIVVVASPHLTRPIRRVGQWLVVALAAVALCLAGSLPTDLLSALVLGWGIAAAVHYAFGTPIGRPTEAEVSRALAALHVPAHALRLAPEQPVGRAIFLAEDAIGPLRISALGRDEADAQFLARAWRSVAYRDAPAIVFPTRRRQVEAEAYMGLLAGTEGARVSRIVYGGSTGPLALLIERIPAGRPFAELDPAEVSDALLDEMWSTLQAVHAARVAHGKLDGYHVVVSEGQPTIVSFELSSTGVRARRAADADVAQILAMTAASVGDERAVAAAARGVGLETLARVIPLLQPRAISGWTHDAFGDRAALDARLEHLRVEGAQVVGTEPPELRQLFRVHPRNVLMGLGTLIAVGTLLSRVGNPTVFWHTIQGADWAFVVLAFALALLTDVVFGITFLGNVPMRLPIWPSIELQIGMAFSNLAVPVAADAAIQVRFLQKNGLDLASATATGGVLSSITEIGVQVVLFFLAVRLSPDTIDVGHVQTGKIAAVVLIAVLLVGVVAAIVFSVRRIRQAVAEHVLRAARTVWDAIRSPSRLSLLLGGNVVTQLLATASLLACIHAFGAGINLWTLLAVNIGVGTLASLVPLPGGGIAVAAIGRAGMLTALGVPHAAAVAAVLTHQIVSSYLLAIPGWFATNDLVRKGLL